MTLSRQRGRAVEEHTWSFSLPPSRVQISPAFAGARISSGRSLGPYGSVALRVGKLGPLRKVVACGTRKPASISRRIVLRNPPASAVRIAPDLSSATIDAAAGAPALAGRLAFTATSPVTAEAVSCNGKGHPSRSGTVQGTMTATFAHAGPSTLTATGGQAVRYR